MFNVSHDKSIEKNNEGMKKEAGKIAQTELIITKTKNKTVIEPAEIEKRVKDWLENFPIDAPVLAVPILASLDEIVESLDSIISNTPSNTPLIYLDDGRADPKVVTTLNTYAKTKGFANVYLPSEAGVVNSLNFVFRAASPRDVVALDSDLIVPAGWLERLKAAAYHRSNIATATPLSNHAGYLSMPHRNRPTYDQINAFTLAQINARLRENSLNLVPIIPNALGHCVYYRRPAINTVGSLDSSFGLDYGSEVDFSLRAVVSGFHNVLADNLFVSHKASASTVEIDKKKELAQAQKELLDNRYPWHEKWLNEAKESTQNPIGRALERGRITIFGEQIAIDATCMTGNGTGTEVVVLELLRAIAVSPNRPRYLGVIINDGIPESVLMGVEKQVDRVFRPSELANVRGPIFDLIHRPFQFFSKESIELDRPLAQRLVVTQLDFIGYSNPTYHPTYDNWFKLRKVFTDSLEIIDGVVFISGDSVVDSNHQGMNVPPERVCVTYAGTDHSLYVSASTTQPESCAQVAGKPFITVMGNSYKHKNRGFALKVFEQLVKKYDWPGHIVFIGPNVVFGHFGADEAEVRLNNPDMVSRIHYFGHVSEDEKHWLLKNSSLMLYPSIYEGFGLPPFEASSHNTPSITTRFCSLEEVLGDSVLYLETLAAETDVDTIWQLLSDPEKRANQVAQVMERAKLFTWEKVAAQTLEFYDTILRLPPRRKPSTPKITYNELEEHLLKVEGKYGELEDWASSLNSRLNSLNNKLLYKILAKLKLL